MNSYSQQNLIGNWRSANPKKGDKAPEDNEPRTGDLSIFQDSTFIIQGDSANLNSKKVEGWVSLDEYKGTWKQPDDKHLTLVGKSEHSKLFLSFSIIKLTKENLVLRPIWYKKKTKFSDLTYERL